MVNKNILRIISDIPENVKLVAISKTKPAKSGVSVHIYQGGS